MKNKVLAAFLFCFSSIVSAQEDTVFTLSYDTYSYFSDTQMANSYVREMATYGFNYFLMLDSGRTVLSPFSKMIEYNRGVIYAIEYPQIGFGTVESSSQISISDRIDSGQQVWIMPGKPILVFTTDFDIPSHPYRLQRDSSVVWMSAYDEQKERMIREPYYDLRGGKVEEPYIPSLGAGFRDNLVGGVSRFSEFIGEEDVQVNGTTIPCYKFQITNRSFGISCLSAASLERLSLAGPPMKGVQTHEIFIDRKTFLPIKEIVQFNGKPVELIQIRD